MKALKISLEVILILVFSVFLVSWVYWIFKPGKALHVLIVNKTVSDYSRSGHKAITWILNHERFLNLEGEKYSLTKDYFGFVPLKPRNSGNYDTRRIRLDDIEKTVANNDLLYMADMYGIYFDEWLSNSMKRGSSSKIIGGINQNDFLLIKAMKEAGKTVLIESNFFVEPTEPLVRSRTEELLNLSYSGWSGKCFNELDTLRNRDLPVWIVNLYKADNQGLWPFKGPGIIFVKGHNSIFVLEAAKHLNHALLTIITEKLFSSKFHLPESIPYNSWFEVILPGEGLQTAAHFSIDANNEGQQMLKDNGIPENLPAILLDKTGKIYYFAGDFANEDIAYYTYRFPFVPYLKEKFGLYANKNDFLWEYYIPLMTEIFNDVYAKRK